MTFWIRSPIHTVHIPRSRYWWRLYCRWFRGWTFHRWLIELRRYESTGLWPYPWWHRLWRRLTGQRGSDPR